MVELKSLVMSMTGNGAALVLAGVDPVDGVWSAEVAQPDNARHALVAQATASSVTRIRPSPPHGRHYRRYTRDRGMPR